MFGRSPRPAWIAAPACTLALAGLATAQSTTRPPGFHEAVVTTALQRPTSMAFAPDGRLFVTEQRGRIRIIKNGQLLGTPFATLTVDGSQSRGILGLAFDPAFLSNGYVYVYYTTPVPSSHNRISRLTASGDLMVPGSELVLFEIDLPTSNQHNGGALQVGPDGLLYQLVGDDTVSSNAQSLATLFGKMLRIRRDGSIPEDNPFYAQTTGNSRAIYAYGVRNGFTIAFQPGTGRMFFHDVGSTGASRREEVNEGVAGANYGWPFVEGYTTNPLFKSPIHAYGPGSGVTAGCAPVGGTFYDPAVDQFPPEYVGKYFFADHCNGWINYLDPDAPGTVVNFASGITSGDRVGTLDLDVGPDGSLYYLLYNGSLFRIFHGPGGPSLTQHPRSQTVTVGRPVTFTVKASGDEPLTYQWRRNNANIPGATSPTYTIPAVAARDNRARFRCRVRNAIATVDSNEAVLTVTTNNEPAADILTPVPGARYDAGVLLQYSGDATDLEDGPPPDAAFTWWVDFHHNDHVHPFLPEATGARAGAFLVPNQGDEKDTDVWYRIHLRVRDAGGLTHAVFRDVHPNLTTLTVDTLPPGLQVTVDGQPRTAPYTFGTVVGMIWTVQALSPQTPAGVLQEFESWSDGGAASHDVVSPATPATLTARYTATLFADDFEIDRGWTRNADRNDTAEDGLWERGAPEPTSAEGIPLQLGTAAGGRSCLVTGRRAGASASVNDVDGGETSIQSPAITLPASGRLALSFEYYFSHLADSSRADFFEVNVAGPSGLRIVFQELGSPALDPAAWVQRSVDISRFAGQTVRIVVQAGDAAGTSVVEAAMDNVKVTHTPSR